MTHKELEALLQDRAMSMASAYLKVLHDAPPGFRMPALAVVMDATGDGGLLVIADIEHRVELLADFAQTHKTVGFALVYDGYVSHQCKHCHNKGCDQCAGTDKRKCDAVMMLVRTAWGFSHSKSMGYGWDSEKHFTMRPEFNFEFGGSTHDDQVLDGYAAVFGPVSVN